MTMDVNKISWASRCWDNIGFRHAFSS